MDSTEATLASHLRWTADMSKAHKDSIPMVERVQSQMNRGEVGPATQGQVTTIQDIHSATADDYTALGAALRSFLATRERYAATNNEAGGKAYLNGGS